MKKHFLIQLCLILSIPITLFAQTNKVDRVNGLILNPLSPYMGQYLSVFYTVASKPLISMDDRQIQVSSIKHIIPSLNISTQSLELPPVELPIVGFTPGYNYILFVFHKQPEFYWVNADGSSPQDPRKNFRPQLATTVSTQVFAFSKIQLEKLFKEQGQPEKITINLQ